MKMKSRLVIGLLVVVLFLSNIVPVLAQGGWRSGHYTYVLSHTSTENSYAWSYWAQTWVYESYTVCVYKHYRYQNLTITMRAYSNYYGRIYCAPGLYWVWE